MRWMLFFCFSTIYLFSQNYPQDYFQAPLDIPLQLSGNFGELRPNHFHAGFDFKTQQREGLNVYAAAEGYVSRIKIATNGYGKAIYITHPNGYTTVYGHLQKAVGAIEAKIQELQYAEKSFAVEAYFKPGELPVKKGELIAISGNTGGSDGPHLHFEFRDSKTEKIINPLYFGIPIKDTKAPTIANLMVYPVGANSVANESKRPTLLSLSLQADGSYLAQKVKATGTIGFAINAYDRDDVSFNNNGTFFTQLSHNGTPTFEVLFDQMPFDEARYVNAFIDYERYKKSHQRFQKLFYNYPYAWSNLRNVKEGGIINVSPNFVSIERIEVSDFNGNKVRVDIPVEYSNVPAKIEEGGIKTPYFIKSKTDALFEKENATVYFPAQTFYDDFYLQFEVKNGEVQVHQDIVPAHKSFTVTIRDDSVPVA
ncbi:MAG: M23 family metallopeptidase, partial [Flavobacterium stagni]